MLPEGGEGVTKQVSIRDQTKELREGQHCNRPNTYRESKEFAVFTRSLQKEMME